MYVAVNEKGNVVAIHDDRDVVENYMKTVQYFHKDVKLSLGKVKNKNAYKYDKLYLVRFGETYIQESYIKYFSFAYSQILEDNKLARDVLFRILEMNRLSQKEEKTIKKAVEIMDNMIYEDSLYTPEISELMNIKDQFDPYLREEEI